MAITRGHLSVRNLQLYILFYTFTFVLIHLSYVNSSENYYDLLGIDNQASAREIRQAFKKLALKLHPDKNKEDPKAHETFLKVNRAYEVLKDEELRKKYDMYGEEGLKEESRFGQRYESWNFYNQEFGIYDDDKEIITLSRSDFDQLVENTDDIWFINFYSPRCSHCHTLAPTWREVARELEGVIRIGAVNCGDDWMTCRSQGIQSYPSLVMYPQRHRYFGERSTDALVEHALSQVSADLVHLNSHNFSPVINNEENSKLPWLITFCGDGGDCLSSKTCTKLAAILKGLANIGNVDCHSSSVICSSLGVEHGTYLFSAGMVEKGKGTEITSLETKEIAEKVLTFLPEVKQLDKSTFKDELEKVEKSGSVPWLIQFVNGEVSDLELRKLPALLSSINVGRVDCRTQRTECNTFHIRKFPTFAIFKQGGGYELHHGRIIAHDVAAFARSSSATNVRVLGPPDFPAVTHSKNPWFIDFYAPWCPPCMRLLPEFRKAARHVGDKIKFGTVDCTIHSRLCQNYNIRSYPTTVFYNDSKPHSFQGGGHDSSHLVEFIEDILKPPVISLDPLMFKNLVRRKSESAIWVIDYFNPHCGPCQQLAPIWRKLAKSLADTKDVYVGQVDCVQHQDFCKRHNIRGYPSIRLYPPGQTNINRYETFSQWFAGEDHIKYWVLSFLPSVAEDLDYNSFTDEVLNGDDAWIVDFYAPWCGHCQIYAPEFEKIAQTVEGRVRAGKVNCDENRYLCQKAGVGAYPTVRFYAAGQNNIYGEKLENRNAQNVLWILNQRVPPAKKDNRTKKDSKHHDEL